MGLRINTQKTEVLIQTADPIQNLQFFINGSPLKTVQRFTYLGSIISTAHNIDEDILNRIQAASASFGRLRTRVFANKNLKLHTKIAVYEAVCISTLLYGSESWTLYKRHLKSLEAFHIRCLQRILDITWKDKIPHTEILQRTNTVSIEATLARRQLRWVGHVKRMPEHRLPRRVLYGQLKDGQRSQGGQRKRFKDHIKTTLKTCNIQPADLETLADNRPLWRSTCTSGVAHLEASRTSKRQEKRARRHQRQTVAADDGPAFPCEVCGKVCRSRIGLHSHRATHQRL